MSERLDRLFDPSEIKDYRKVLKDLGVSLEDSARHKET
jgi:hypothetical protein